MRMVTASFMGILLTVSAVPPSFAKGKTTKITIEGADLKRPIEITDRQILANFNVWTGPGTGSNAPGFNPNAPGFIIDWSQGPVPKVPQNLRRYQISFHADPNEQVVYVVYYEFSPGSEKGYVYVPGESDKWFGLNVRSLSRGPEAEGKWFQAWSSWEHLARPLIEKTR